MTESMVKYPKITGEYDHVPSHVKVMNSGIGRSKERSRILVQEASEHLMKLSMMAQHLDASEIQALQERFPAVSQHWVDELAQPSVTSSAAAARHGCHQCMARNPPLAGRARASILIAVCNRRRAVHRVAERPSTASRRRGPPAYQLPTSSTRVLRRTAAKPSKVTASTPRTLPFGGWRGRSRHLGSCRIRPRVHADQPST